jgi:hypothetical protein
VPTYPTSLFALLNNHLSPATVRISLLAPLDTSSAFCRLPSSPGVGSFLRGAKSEVCSVFVFAFSSSSSSRINSGNLCASCQIKQEPPEPFPVAASIVSSPRKKSKSCPLHLYSRLFYSISALLPKHQVHRSWRTDPNKYVCVERRSFSTPQAQCFSIRLQHQIYSIDFNLRVRSPPEKPLVVSSLPWL